MMRLSMFVTNKCLKKILLSKNLQIVDTWTYFEMFNSLDYALAEGCVSTVLQNQENISQICEQCQNVILNRFYSSDVYTIEID